MFQLSSRVTFSTRSADGVLLAILTVAGTGDCNADISYYKKENGNWELKWTEKGYVGRNGITDTKKEGDGATPSGVYSFDLAFGLLDDPGSVPPYHTTKGDFWVDLSSQSSL